MPETDTKEKTEKIKLWLKDGYNLAIVIILISAFLFRAYLFFYSSGQTIWYDESEYGSMAKHYVFNVPYELSPKRPFTFSGIMSILMLINFSEQSIKFLMVLIPSTLLVLFVFLLGREMFNKKVAVISALLTAVSWTLLFWATRMQPDSISMCFQVLAILFMWKFFKNFN